MRERSVSAIMGEDRNVKSNNKKLFPHELQKKPSTSFLIVQAPVPAFKAEGNSTSKKHFSTTKPSKETLQRNDKSNLLPIEYSEKYRKPYSRTNSV